MNRMLSTILLWVLGLAPAYATIQSGVDELLNKISPTINIGIEVVDLATGRCLYQRNQDRYFIPASNMKLFSEAAALMILGPDYHFTNQLSTDASQLQQGVLDGSLYLHLPGDPSLDHNRLATLISKLKKWGITRILGDIVIDSGYAEVDIYPPGWVKKDLDYSYGAPVAPLIMDRNRLTVTVNPAGRADQAAVVEVIDPSGTVQIENQVMTRSPKAHCGIDFSMTKENYLRVRGCIGAGQWAIRQQVAIRNPFLYAQGLLQHQLKENNIHLKGTIILGKLPSRSMLVAKDTSRPITQLMADTLKPSDNLYADSMFLHSAAKLFGKPVNWYEAESVLKKFLQHQTGIALGKATLLDGSGLSRKDLLTPHQTVSLLRFLHDRFPLSYEYIAALPVSGRDGTLQRRFKTSRQRDLVRAKTGTMAGVVTLSGYLSTANAHTLAFAIFINNRPGTKLTISGRYRYLVDALCGLFLRQRPSEVLLKQVAAQDVRLKFQQNTTQAELQRQKEAKWRQLEAMVKKVLLGRAITILYHNDELILYDNSLDSNIVLSRLKQLETKYAFALALMTQLKPATPGNKLLWINTLSAKNVKRIWAIREAV